MLSKLVLGQNAESIRIQCNKMSLVHLIALTSLVSGVAIEAAMHHCTLFKHVIMGSVWGGIKFSKAGKLDPLQGNTLVDLWAWHLGSTCGRVCITIMNWDLGDADVSP